MFCILVEHRIMFHNQEDVVVFLQDGHELKYGSTDINIREVMVQATEDAGVVAANEVNLIALQGEMAVEGIDQHLHRGNPKVESISEDGDLLSALGLRRRSSYDRDYFLAAGEPDGHFCAHWALDYALNLSFKNIPCSDLH